MARPRINDKDKRIAQINIRLTHDEEVRINQYAVASGISPANWIRKKVFTGKLPDLKLSPLDASIYQELRKIGVNLNQATHRLNQGDVPKNYLILQLELLTLLNKILKALLNDRQSISYADRRFSEVANSTKRSASCLVFPLTLPQKGITSRNPPPLQQKDKAPT